MAQIAPPSPEHQGRIAAIHLAYAANLSMREKFPSLADFENRMLSAMYAESPEHQTEFASAADFAAYSRWAARWAAKN